MVRKTRTYFTTAVYHVTFRGNNRQKILSKSEDKMKFLDIIAKFKDRFYFKIYALCLMDNHGHLLIETNPSFSISRIMQSILLSYSFSYRKKNSYSGHVFQGRFNSSVINGDKYLLECIEYIHNNPVLAKIVDTPEAYTWSSCYMYEGGENSNIDKILELDRHGDTSIATY